MTTHVRKQFTAAQFYLLRRLLFLTLILTLNTGLLVSLSAASSAGSAQNPISLTPQKDPTSDPGALSLPVSDDAIQKAIEQLENRLKTPRFQESVTGEPAADKTALPVAAPDEFRKRRHLQSELAVMLDAHAQALRDLRGIRKANKDRSSEMNSWEGFSEKPPFPVSFIDGLRDEISNQRNDAQSLQLRLSIIKGELNKYVRALRESRAQMRLQDEALEKAAGTAKEGRQRWLRDMAHLKNELNEAAVASFETRRLVTEESITAQTAYLRFLELKLRAAEQVSPLSKPDIDKKLLALDSQRKQIAAELAQAIKKEEETTKIERQHREELEKLQSQANQEGAGTAGNRKMLLRLQATLDLQAVLAAAARERVEVLKAMVQLIDYSETLWEERLLLSNNPALGEIRDKSEEVRTILDNLQLWKSVVQSRILTVLGLVQNKRLKLEMPNSPAEVIQQDRLSLKTLEDRHALLLRVSDQLAATIRLASHFRDELAEHQDKASLESRLRDTGMKVIKYLKALWFTELYVAEETVVVEGAKVAKPISVTVAKVVQALLIFFAGVWLARKLMRPLRWTVIHKFRQDKSIAAQIGTVAFLLLFVAVFVFSLVSVNIPLAVFAFLGGALAIGIGFGAQNLINNFISGLILLFDRSISVGDLIEVDGQGGKVTSIGMRSSLVHRFDGVEMLIPNSQFLQQKVINWTHSERKMRYSISVGVAYGSPVRKVTELLLRAIDEQESVLKSPEPLVILDDFADSSLLFSAYFWLELESIRDNRILMSEIRVRVLELFEEHGIVIPFPQRDVHLNVPAPVRINMAGTSHTGRPLQPDKS